MSAKPALIFQAFGTLDSTRLVPVAAVVDGQLKPIELPTADWRLLDSLYFQPGTAYAVYRDGRAAGTVTVTRRMWEPDSEPLYALPGCREVRPMAAVALKATVPLEPMFEFLALTAARAPSAAAAPTAGADVTPAVRALVLSVLRAEQLDSADIDTASFSARDLHVAANGKATLVGSQVDANAGDTGPGSGQTTHFLVVGDDADGKGYKVTYKHLQIGEARTVEFQRLLDHLDLTGDGTDELVLESWRYASDNELVVLARNTGSWRETLRIPQKWCVRQR